MGKATLIAGDHKFIVSDPKGKGIRSAAWSSRRPDFSNSSATLPSRDAGHVDLNYTTGCLFDVVHEPEECYDLIASMPALVSGDKLHKTYCLRRYFPNTSEVRIDIRVMHAF